MKAILRGAAGLLGLLLAGSFSFGYVLVSPVFKQPYPQAPDMFNSGGYYLIDGWGRLTGPYYNLRPPCPPFGGMLPGKTGQAIMSGPLPHTLLMSKEGLAIGQVPLVGQKTAKGTPDQSSPGPGAGLPEMGGPPGAYMVAGAPSTLGPMNAPNPNLQIPYGQMPNLQIPYGQMPNPNMQAPYGQMPYPMPNPNVQVPYTQLPYSMQQAPYGAMPYPMQQAPYGAMPYPMQPAPYGAMPYRAMPASMPYPMPYGAAPMPSPMPYGTAPMPMQPRMTYYPVSNGNYAWYYDPRTAIAQAQSVVPGPQPFMPIPGFGVPGAPPPPGMPMAPPPPGMPTAPMPPGGPGMGPGPGMDMGGQNGFQYFTPMQQADRFNQFSPLQRMQPPTMQMEPMQLPRMEYTPPPPVKVGGNAYPTHPFVRSPRDFFMWGENMEDEERARKRPFPVP